MTLKLGADKERFKQRVLELCASSGRPVRQYPTIASKPLDFLQLFVAVQARGGYRKIVKWRDIGVDLNIPESVTNCAFILRQKYESFLLPFERELLQEFQIISNGQTFVQDSNFVPPPQPIFVQPAYPLYNINQNPSVQTVHLVQQVQQNQYPQQFISPQLVQGIPLQQQYFYTNIQLGQNIQSQQNIYQQTQQALTKPKQEDANYNRSNLNSDVSNQETNTYSYSTTKQFSHLDLPRNMQAPSQVYMNKQLKRLVLQQMPINDQFLKQIFDQHQNVEEVTLCCLDQITKIPDNIPPSLKKIQIFGVPDHLTEQFTSKIQESSHIESSNISITQTTGDRIIQPDNAEEMSEQKPGGDFDWFDF